MTNPSALITAGLERVNRHDLDGYCALFADDVVWVAEPWGTFTGRDEATGYLERGLDAVPDHQRRVEKLLVSGDDVATWVSFTGTFQGRPVEMEFCTIFTVRDDRIVRVVEHADWRPIIEAMGLTG
jgi:ketosteroid isomerase-like protein